MYSVCNREYTQDLRLAVYQYMDSAKDSYICRLSSSVYKLCYQSNTLCLSMKVIFQSNLYPHGTNHEEQR